MSIERLQAGWTALIYAFYEPEVTITHINNRRAHRFHCAALGCKSSILRYLDTNDSTSTGNLRKHVRGCKKWGDEALDIAEEAGLNAEKTRECLQNVMRAGSIEKAFERKGKGKVSYSSRQHTREETRYVSVFNRVSTDRLTLSLDTGCYQCRDCSMGMRRVAPNSYDRGQRIQVSHEDRSTQLLAPITDDRVKGHQDSIQECPGANREDAAGQ